jgi:hypothetical protein
MEINEDLVQEILQIYNKHKDHCIEIEFRLGIKFPDKFSSNITKRIYEILLNKFEKSYLKGIFKKDLHNTVDYYINSNRLSVNLDTNECVLCKKNKIFTKDINIDGPMDIRVSVSTEDTITCDKNEYLTNYQIKRTKERITYVYKEWNYDLTIITQEKNKLIETNYEFELEINNINCLEKQILSTFHKMNDIINLIGDE